MQHIINQFPFDEYTESEIDNGIEIEIADEDDEYHTLEEAYSAEFNNILTRSTWLPDDEVKLLIKELQRWLTIRQRHKLQNNTPRSNRT